MFKTTFKTFAMALMACVTMASFTACGGDDDDPTPPATKKATEAYAQNVIYTTANTLKYCKVEVTDMDGNTFELKADQCTEVSSFPKDNAYDLTTVRDATQYGDKWLKYEQKKVTFKSFPTKTYSVSVTTSATDAKPTADFMPFAMPVVTISNNYPGGTQWSKKEGTIVASVSGGVKADRWDDYVARSFPKTYTYTFSLESADKMTQRGL